MIVLQNMLVLFLIMLVGCYAYKKQMLTDEINKKLSGIIVNIANPAIILSAVVDGDTSSVTGDELVMTVGISLLVYGVLLLIAEIIPRLLRVDKEDYGMYQAMTVFSNMGYMGFPVILSVYGSTALLYASIFLIPFNILLYTYGVFVINKGEKMKLKAFFNNGVLACLVMIILFLSKITVPQVLSDTIVTIGEMTVPISMMIIGSSLSKIKLNELFLDYKLLIFSGIRLFILPVAGIFLMKQFCRHEIILGVTLVVLATPVGSLTVMMAQEYGGNDLLASRGVTLTTLLSVVMIPIVFAVTGL